MYRGGLLAMLGVMASIASGCGSSDEVSMDAPGPCWPVVTPAPTPGAAIRIGTGEMTYEPMPDEPRLVFGPQGGFHIVVHAQVTAIKPGDPANVLDGDNPRTRFRAFFVDTGLPINSIQCGFRVGYKPVADDVYELAASSAVLFDVGVPESQIFGRQVRVVADIIDVDNTYATDEKVVTCREPLGWAN